MGHNTAFIARPTPAQIQYAIWVSKQHFDKKCVISGEAHLSYCALNGSHIKPRGETRLAANPHNIVPIAAVEDQAFEKIPPGKRIAYLLERVATFNRADFDKVLEWINLLRMDAAQLKISVEY